MTLPDADGLSPKTETCPEVAIVVLNWNNYEDTAECLKSLEDIEYPKFSVWVVDNNSTDGSEERLSKEFGWCRFIFNNANDGFAAGNNIGIKQALSTEAEYVLLLNNDTVVPPSFLTKLVRTGESFDDIGIIGPTILDYEDGDVLDSGRTFNRYTMALKNPYEGKRLDEIEGQRNSHIVIGCCMLIKREVIDDVGLLDDLHFFFGGEDVDYCIRARKAGWEIVVRQDTHICHKVDATSRSISPPRKYHTTRNKIHLYKLHVGEMSVFSIIFRAMIDFLTATRYIYRGHWRMVRSIYLGYVDAIRGRSENNRFG